MSEVTREDVLRVCDIWDANGDDPLGKFDHLADALIAAFPHLVGEVVEIDTEHSTYDLRTQEVYKVYAPWREAER